MSDRWQGRDDVLVAVYRVVDETELAFLAAHGHYGSNVNLSGKYFALTVEEARAFARAPMNAGAAITRTTLPASMVRRGTILNDPGTNGAGMSVFFARQQLADLYDIKPVPVILSGAET